MNNLYLSRVVFGFFCFFILVNFGYAQTITESKIRLYNHPMNPRQHPDDKRRAVQPPDADLFGNRIQFISLRGFDDDYRSTLDNIQ
jgi:hypothetical protein